MADGMAKRGTNYTTEEDVCIARAYVHITTDPIAGSEQVHSTYYGRMYSAYKIMKPADAVLRTESSIESRVKDMQKHCVRFSACIANVKAMKRSGVSADDKIRLATALFNKKPVQHPNEDVGRRFKYLEAWEVLRVLPKYAAAGEASSSGSAASGSAATATKAGIVSDSGVDAADNADGSVERRKRPIGRMRAKAEKAKEEQANKKLRLANSALELQKKQVKELEEHNIILLFTNGPGGADSDLAKEFFAMKQKAVIEKMRTEVEESAMNVLAEFADESTEQ